MTTNYSDHAMVWDWDGYDNTPEYEYWCTYAKVYGNNVLIPMCALGQTGAYMAKKGFNVMAFDYTPEMIAEGKKRFGSVKNLELVCADICNFSHRETGFDFVFTMDLQLLDSMDKIKKALLSLSRHTRKGGCLVIEIGLPSKESWESPARVFHPRKANYTDKKIWKEGRNRYDASTKIHHIDQIIFIEDERGTTQINHSIKLYHYERDELVQALRESGYSINSEYSNRDKQPWKPGESTWIVEAIL